MVIFFISTNSIPFLQASFSINLSLTSATSSFSLEIWFFIANKEFFISWSSGLSAHFSPVEFCCVIQISSSVPSEISKALMLKLIIFRNRLYARQSRDNFLGYSWMKELQCQPIFRRVDWDGWEMQKKTKLRQIRNKSPGQTRMRVDESWQPRIVAGNVSDSRLYEQNKCLMSV